jgi:hypothetical protein
MYMHMYNIIIIIIIILQHYLNIFTGLYNADTPQDRHI